MSFIDVLDGFYKCVTLISLSVILITCIAWIDDMGPSLRGPRWMVRRMAIIGTTVGCMGVMIRVLTGSVDPQMSLTLLSVGMSLGMVAHVEVGWWNFVWKGCARRPPREQRTSTAQKMTK